MKQVDKISLAELKDMSAKMQADLWGINIFPDKFGTSEFIEYDSMINIRPRQNNPSRTVLSDEIKAEIVAIVDGVVHE